jgi:uncharacterized protein YndB with AHSA1/START domain
MQRYLMVGAGFLVVGFAGFLFTASSRPKEFHLERSILTDASAADVYAAFSDFSRFKEWSPWQKLDPNMATELSGEQGHVGASYSWEGNTKVGAGRMTITELVPNSHVNIQLEFLRPFAATNSCQWRVTEENGRRRITWSMDGSNDTLFKRAFAMLANMDKLVGKDFEAGLASLKLIAEAAPAAT